jgi:hypothetical protein
MPDESSSKPVATAAPASQPRADAPALSPDSQPKATLNREVGGPKGPEPTRFGDWERAGRCIDF